jgi:hypothetical protein
MSSVLATFVAIWQNGHPEEFCRIKFQMQTKRNAIGLAESTLEEMSLEHIDACVPPTFSSNAGARRPRLGLHERTPQPVPPPLKRLTR